MYQMKHDVLDHTHADVRALFNAWLADSINLMQQTKEAYWKVQETMCTALHTLFDGIVDAETGEPVGGHGVSCGMNVEWN